MTKPTKPETEAKQDNVESRRTNLLRMSVRCCAGICPGWMKTRRQKLRFPRMARIFL